jgi:hypothetical protein
MSPTPDDIDWSLTTWEGVRREQLRRAAAFTLRERMQSLEDMAEVAERFRQMRESGKPSVTRDEPAASVNGAPVVARQPMAGYEPDNK